jgi:hypothetical protein
MTVLRDVLEEVVAGALEAFEFSVEVDKRIRSLELTRRLRSMCGARRTFPNAPNTSPEDASGPRIHILR